MKRLIQFSIFVLITALSQRAEAAPFTNFLDTASNEVAQAASAATTVRARTLLHLALRDLRAPSTSVARDYRMFTSVANHVRPLQGQAQLIIDALSNAFPNFVFEAQDELLSVSNAVAALTPFQPLRRSASNQLALAQSRIDGLTGSMDRQNLAALTFAYNKISVARNLLRVAQRHPGLAPDSAVGKTLTHHQSGSTGTVIFTDETNCTEQDQGGSDVATYTWTRTGLNTIRLVITRPDNETRVTATFSTATSGIFVFRHFENGTQAGTGTGTFTLRETL